MFTFKKLLAKSLSLRNELGLDKVDRRYYKSLGGPSGIAPSDLYSSVSDVPGYQVLGQYQEGPQGSWFRYVKAGASNLVVGNLIQSPAFGTGFNDLAVPAAVAAGATGGITITNGSTVVAANDFAGGSLEVSVTPGLGEEYTITGNAAAGSGAALVLYLDRPIRTAWTTSTKVTLTFNPWNGVIQSPATTLTGVDVGIAIYPITAGQYGWVQTHGVAACLSDASSIIMGSGVTGGSGTAGAVTLHVAGFQVVGTAMRAAATGKTIPVDLCID